MLQTSIELLENSLQEWGALHGRRLTDEALRVWMRIFTATPPKVLALALETLTKSSERMPTPGHLSKAIEITYEKHPELCPDRKLWGAEGKDPKGVPCIYWSDEKMVPAYKAKDCPEGRAFLKLLREIAGKKSINNAAPPHANGG